MIIYIKEMDNNDKLGVIDNFPKIIQKIIKKIIELTNNFYEINIDSKTKKYIIPNIENNKVYKKIVKKIKKISKVELVLSKDVKKYSNKFDKIKIIDGNEFYLKNIYNIIKIIVGNNPVETADVYILTNKYVQKSVNFIKDIVKKVKAINIISTQIEKYKILEEILLEEGYSVNVSNNKRKSLKKAKIIINLDYSKEEILAYNLYRNSCIININNDIIIDNIKGFEGIIIQNIDIEIPNENLKFFKENNLYSSFYKNDLYKTIKEIGEAEKIENLYGNNGKIDKKELINIQKILTN